MILFLIAALLAGKSLATISPWTHAWDVDPVGPDGPWHALFVITDDPYQNFTLLPSMTKTTLLVAEAACSNQSSACPIPRPKTLWTSSVAHSHFLYMNGDMWDASTWDDTISGPLRLQGNGMIIHDLFTLWSDPKRWDLVDQVASLTEDFTVEFPGDVKYTIDVGFFSLNGAEENVTWTSANGSEISLHLQLPNAYEREVIPSISYGLHIGSPHLKIKPSLILGGYDRARCLNDPIASKSQTFELIDITIGIDEGNLTFINQSKSPDLTSSNGVISSLLGKHSGIQVMPNPGVPYLYLPLETCDAIAQHLPVTYSKDFGLYLWDIDNPAFDRIVTSPSYLAFTMEGSDSQIATIKVPFALLNLTLGNPLVANPTPYFPCSPYNPADEDKPYHLGRAFLQAALLAQNWQSKTVWLAQAPGPEVPPDQVTTIETTDSTISKMPNGPELFSTWKAALKAVSDPSKPTKAAKKAVLSGGSVAAIVIGAIVAIVLLTAALLYLLKRRRRHQAETGGRKIASGNREVHPAAEKSGQGVCEAASTPVFEASCAEKSPTLVDMPVTISKYLGVKGEDDGIAELPGHQLEGR